MNHESTYGNHIVTAFDTLEMMEIAVIESLITCEFSGRQKAILFSVRWNDLLGLLTSAPLLHTNKLRCLNVQRYLGYTLNL